MKDFTVGDDSYKAKGLKKAIAWIKPGVERRFLKAARKRGWKKTQLYSYWLTKHVPK